MRATELSSVAMACSGIEALNELAFELDNTIDPFSDSRSRQPSRGRSEPESPWSASRMMNQECPVCHPRGKHGGAAGLVSRRPEAESSAAQVAAPDYFFSFTMRPFKQAASRRKDTLPWARPRRESPAAAAASGATRMRGEAGQRTSHAGATSSSARAGRPEARGVASGPSVACGYGCLRRGSRCLAQTHIGAAGRSTGGSSSALRPVPARLASSKLARQPQNLV